MTFTNRRGQTRVELVANHLQTRGHISEGSALIEYGRFRLADVIHRLRTDRSDLVPEGWEIVTHHKKDTQGNPYGEYHLVQTAARRQRELQSLQKEWPEFTAEATVLQGCDQSGD